MISLLGVRTVDDSEDSPEQEDDDECERLFALHAGDALDEDEIERERRHDDRRIEQLHTYDTIRYDTRCYFNVRSKADTSQLNLPHGNDSEKDKKLSYRRGTARCVVSIEILPIATQQCRNYLYDKSWPNRWYEDGDLVGGNA